MERFIADMQDQLKGTILGASTVAGTDYFCEGSGEGNDDDGVNIGSTEDINEGTEGT
jgi:hypothetical protein